MKLHLEEIFGEGDLRTSYILSIIPRLTSRLFRNNIKFIKNKEVNHNGWESLKNTFEAMAQSIYELNIKEYSLQLLSLNQEEMAKTRFFIHLLSLEKRQLLLEIQENEMNFTANDFNSILDLKTFKRGEFNETEKRTLLKFMKQKNS
mmetsp:Transcript_3026/g.3708  ORF Transcript_3026/g.3708 Transcript_3026/m.3708 type:complete len:147 (-) Transcript_3026:31-471(-)